jgi:hypothetical protein
MAPRADTAGNLISYPNHGAAGKFVHYNEIIADGQDVTGKWMENDLTDAAMFEESLQGLFSSGLVSTSVMDEYFFSPREQRIYLIRAKVGDGLQIVEGYRPNPPNFSATPPFSPDNPQPSDYFSGSTGHITLSEINAAHASSYDVYWGPMSIAGDIDKSSETWYDRVGWIGKTLGLEGSFVKIADLPYNQTYTVCVAARNRYGLSDPNCIQVAIPPKPAGSIGVPFASVQVTTGGVYVTGITAENARADNPYSVYWKLKSINGDTVGTAPWHSVTVTSNAAVILQISINEELSTGNQPGPIVVRVLAHNSEGIVSEAYNYDAYPVYYKEVLGDGISNIGYACGTFGDLDGTAGGRGMSIVNHLGIPLSDGYMFQYGYTLNGTLNSPYNIWDAGVSGPFGMDQTNRYVAKYLRVVYNGCNIADPCGLSLIPMAKNLSAGMISPPSNQIYIDPIRGEFVLPRPSYWSRCESADNIINAEIKEGTPEYSNENSIQNQFTAKFGSGFIAVGSNTSAYIEKDAYIYPEGINYSGSGSGTASFWINFIRNETPTDVQVRFAFSGASAKHNETTGIYVVFISNPGTSGSIWFMENGSLKTYYNKVFSGWMHVYIVWDNNGGLSGGKYMKVFLNGTEGLSRDESFAITEQFIGLSAYVNNAGNCYAAIDNIKIWKHVVSEDPSWEYNNGDGIEDAMHSIYGPLTGYKPDLSATTSRVGYLYK